MSYASANPLSKNQLANVTPNSKPENSKDQNLQSQIIELQASVAYLELTLDSLDKVISKQDRQIQDMQRQLQLLFSRVTDQSDPSIAPFDVVSEVPPHY